MPIHKKKAIYLTGLFLLIINSTFSQHIFSAEMEQMAAEYVADKNNKGLVIGIIAGDKTDVRGFGILSDDKKIKPDGQTIFEIGGITQTFTTSLMMLESYKGTFSLGDRVEDYAPVGVRIPNYQHLVCTEYSLPPDFDGYDFDNRIVSCQPDPGTPAVCIAFCDLATHTSGLPADPKRFPGKWFHKKNPYGHYSKDNLYKNLAKYPPATAPGICFNYSNIGMALLGNIIADNSGKTYDELLQSAIARPLNMQNTAVRLNRMQLRQLAQGHNKKGKATHHWQLTGMAPAGGVKSSANDLVTFLKASLGISGDQLIVAACQQTQVPQLELEGRVLGRPTAAGYGWFVSSLNDTTSVVWNTGSTAGFRSFIGFVGPTTTGVVVLSNSANGVEEIGFSILDILNTGITKGLSSLSGKKD